MQLYLFSLIGTIFLNIHFSLIILNTNIRVFFQHLLERTLGLCLVLAPPPEEQRLSVLNEVWKSIMKLKNPGVSI